MRHTRIFYKERRHRAGCKVCTVALALCFIGLAVAVAHGRRGFAPTDIRQLRAICHKHAAWLATGALYEIRRLRRLLDADALVVPYTNGFKARVKIKEQTSCKCT